MALVVSSADVAAYAPDAPAVTPDQIQEALDWAEPALARQGIVLVPNSAQERAARRAVMNYALHLAVGQERHGSLAEAGTTIKVQDRFSVQVGSEAADGLLDSAQTYSAAAWANLYRAGVPRPRPWSGVSR